MDLSIYDIIRGPVVTSKAQRLNARLHQLVLDVHPKANKPKVKEAIERLFNVKVERVNIEVRKGKKRMVNRRPVLGKLKKRAIVTLAPGYEMNIFENVDARVVAPQAEQASK